MSGLRRCGSLGRLSRIQEALRRDWCLANVLGALSHVAHISGSVHGDRVEVASDEELTTTSGREDGVDAGVLESSLNNLGPLEFKPRKRTNSDRPWDADPIPFGDYDEEGSSHPVSEMKNDASSDSTRGPGVLYRNDGAHSRTDYSSSLGSIDGPNTSADAHRGRVPEEETGAAVSDRKYQAFPSGLSYHAWEVKLRNAPLRSSSLLDDLYKKNRSDPNLVNEGVMSVLTDISVLERAFMSMYLRHGQLVDGEKLFKQIGESWAKKVGSRLLTGEYTFPHPSQLEPRDKFRQPKLENVPIWWHKMVPEAMRMVLEAIFEPNFSRLAHGFRRSRGCHSALKEVKDNFGGVDYFMEVDISRCMTGFDKGQLIDALRTRVRDTEFLQLVNRAIRAGYLDMSEICYRSVGVPQTTLISPVLCNLYLHKMDLFFEDLSRCLEVGADEDSDPVSSKAKSNVVSNRDRWASRRIQPANCWREWTLSRVRYVRYGGNLLIGINGSSEDAVRVEKDLQWFVRSQLMLPTKGAYSKIASSGIPDREYVMFLGAEIYVSPQITSPGFDARNAEAAKLPTKPRLCVPARHLLLKLEEAGFTDANKRRPTFNGKLVHWDAHEIVKFYDVTAKMFVSYYSFADNYHCLSLLFDILKQSCAMTLGKKLSLKRLHWVTKRFGKDLGVWDSGGNLLSVMTKPRFSEPNGTWNGRDINPFARLERPYKPKFPPSTEKPVTGAEAYEFTVKARAKRFAQ